VGLAFAAKERYRRGLSLPPPIPTLKCDINSNTLPLITVISQNLKTYEKKINLQKTTFFRLINGDGVL
jgi:hypothetical protein